MQTVSPENPDAPALSARIEQLQAQQGSAAERFDGRQRRRASLARTHAAAGVLPFQGLIPGAGREAGGGRK